MKYFYKTILQNYQHEIPKIKGSKFIGHIFHIKNQKEADSFIQEIKQKYKDANHNCYAYTYGTNTNFDLFGNLKIQVDKFRQSDDGEPTNTAGKPILAQIQGHDLHNILLIVTRYFGGTLLGVGGLIQAYSECAKQTILNSKVEKVELTETLKINFEHKDISKIMNLLHRYQAKILTENYDKKVEIVFEINKGYLKDETLQQLNITIIKRNNG